MDRTSHDKLIKEQTNFEKRMDQLRRESELTKRLTSDPEFKRRVDDEQDELERDVRLKRMAYLKSKEVEAMCKEEYKRAFEQLQSKSLSEAGIDEKHWRNMTIERLQSFADRDNLKEAKRRVKEDPHRYKSVVPHNTINYEDPEAHWKLQSNQPWMLTKHHPR